MFNRQPRPWREEVPRTWLSIVGAVAIVGLLWAIGLVVQGQVERGQARSAELARVEPPARCTLDSGAACAAEPAARGADDGAVPVVYR